MFAIFTGVVCACIQKNVHGKQDLIMVFQATFLTSVCIKFCSSIGDSGFIFYLSPALFLPLSHLLCLPYLHPPGLYGTTPAHGQSLTSAKALPAPWNIQDSLCIVEYSEHTHSLSTQWNIQDSQLCGIFRTLFVLWNIQESLPEPWNIQELSEPWNIQDSLCIVEYSGLSAAWNIQVSQLYRIFRNSLNHGNSKLSPRTMEYSELSPCSVESSGLSLHHGMLMHRQAGSLEQCPAASVLSCGWGRADLSCSQLHPLSRKDLNNNISEKSRGTGDKLCRQGNPNLIHEHWAMSSPWGLLNVTPK